MAQRPTADFNIDPNITSGTDLANILNRFQDAIDSGNSGSSRPAYLEAGGLWVREGDPMRLYLYDGTTDRELYNTTDGIVGGSQWKNDGINIYYDEGNVGINTDRPSVSLEVDGQVKFGIGNPWVTSTNILKSSAPAGTDGAHLRASVSTYEYPTYANSNDTDTGMYFPASNELAFSTGGAGRMTIDANGRVGIGTDNPQANKLDVASVDSSNYNAGDPSADIIVSRKNTSNAINESAGIRFDVTGFAGTTTGGAAIEALQLGNESSASLAFLTRNEGAWGERMRIDASGNVGIGGEPGTRAIDEAKALAKTKLTKWKAEVKKRTAEQPEASTQEITLEVTDGDFGVMPTEEALAEFLQGRAIGGGDAKLQVAGDGYFSGTVNCATVKNPNTEGLIFGSTGVMPTTDNAVDLGRNIAPAYRFKDAHFSGTVYANGSPLTRVGDIIETFRTLKNAVSDETTVEGIKEALTNSLGGLIEKFEAMQSAATQEIES